VKTPRGGRLRITDRATSQAELDTPRWADAAAKEASVRWVSDGGKLLRVVRAAASVHTGSYAGKPEAEAMGANIPDFLALAPAG